MEYTHAYSFTGLIIPNWVKLSPLEIEAPIEGAGDCPNCLARIAVNGAKLTGTLLSEKPFENLGTLWNVMEGHSQALIDAVAFANAAKIDVYIDSIRDDTCKIQLQLDSISHELASALKDIGVQFSDISKLMCNRRYEYHLRHAFFHARKALTYPNDTSLHGYRMVETLLNYFVDTSGITRENNGRPPKDAWAAFREKYGLDEAALRRLAELSRPLRHGNYRDATVLDGPTRQSVLHDIWLILGTFINAEVKK